MKLKLTLQKTAREMNTARTLALAVTAAAGLAAGPWASPPLQAADAALLPTTTAGQPAVAPLTVAIFDFEAREAPDLGRDVSALINATLSAEANLITVERAELAKVLGEQELGLSGTVSTETAAKVGHLTGAKVLVTGRLFKVGTETVMVAKIISVETSRVYGEMAKGRGEPTEMAADLARKIAKTVAEKGETLVARVASREERIKGLREKLGDRKRPSVFVHLPERHYGAPVNDPAAETEFMKILQETGFTVAPSEAKADVVISGEAFSAAAGRKANLIIARARIEIKAVQSSSGRVLSVDRETGVAVDLAEQTAGKTALQSTAETLALRALPKLVDAP